MIKTKLGIDEILTINLQKRKDRKKSFSERFQTINFDFISAVDGTKLDIKKLIKAGKIGQTQFDPQGSTNKYVIGCGLSHLNAWEKFNKSKSETCLILEDDAIQVNDLPKIYPKDSITYVGGFVYNKRGVRRKAPQTPAGKSAAAAAGFTFDEDPTGGFAGSYVVQAAPTALEQNDIRRQGYNPESGGPNIRRGKMGLAEQGLVGVVRATDVFGIGDILDLGRQSPQFSQDESLMTKEDRAMLDALTPKGVVKGIAGEIAESARSGFERERRTKFSEAIQQRNVRETQRQIEEKKIIEGLII